MSAGDPPRPVHVTGGRYGVQADADAIAHLARRFAGAGTDTLATAMSLHGLAAGVAFSGSSLLDPAGLAAVESELLWALDGPQGLSWAGTECTALAGELRIAASTYVTADQLYQDGRDAVTGVLGAGPALVAGAHALAGTGNPLLAAQAVLVDDPALTDVAVRVLGLPALLGAIARDLPDGHGIVRAEGLDTYGLAGRPPRDLADVLGDLRQRDADGRSGSIDVRILTRADGTRRVIVDVTGTKSWDPLPTTDVTSLTTNARALVGAPTAYEQGVLIAMRRSGVRRDDPVMIVGHSEGGMVAVNAARDAVRAGAFTVASVITAGSPVGRTAGELPHSVQLLALENARDVVPHLDGRANPDRANVTTVTGTRGNGTVVDDHSLDDAYVPLARDTEHSGNRSVRAFLSGARDWFDAVTVETHTYEVHRSY